MGGLQTNISKGRIQTHKGTFEEKSGAAFNHVFLYEDPLQVVQPSYVEVGMSLLLDVVKVSSIMYNVCNLSGEDWVPF
jgi:hypothetical protein